MPPWGFANSADFTPGRRCEAQGYEWEPAEFKIKNPYFDDRSKGAFDPRLLCVDEVKNSWWISIEGSEPAFYVAWSSPRS